MLRTRDVSLGVGWGGGWGGDGEDRTLPLAHMFDATHTGCFSRGGVGWGGVGMMTYLAHICVRFMYVLIYIYVYFFEDIYIYIYIHMYLSSYTFHIDIFYITDFNFMYMFLSYLSIYVFFKKWDISNLTSILLELLLFADSIEIEMLTNPCPRIHDVRPALLSLQT